MAPCVNSVALCDGRSHGGAVVQRIPSVRVCQSGQVRIIAGKWRNTRLPVPAIAGLRPTTDRVRETLFNWLTPCLAGARVLDLFAGSGALGIEAISRGARSCVLVERHRQLYAQLCERVAHLHAQTQLEVIRADAIRWLQQTPVHPFDLVFCDPPFDQALWHWLYPVLTPHLVPSARIYIESPARCPADPPPGCQLDRQGRTAEVHFALYRYCAEGAGTLRPLL